jgi:protein-disulfide isomerase
MPKELTVTDLSRLKSDSRGQSRRSALVLVGSALAMTPLSTFAFAQRKPVGPDQIDVAELMKAGNLPELSLGKDDAPCTIVEYASMTCGHCAAFHTKVYPTLKTKYVETGKVRFVFREFPLEDFAMAASMLARGTGSPEKALALVSILFAKQEDWAFAKTNKIVPLFQIAKQAGFTQESFDKVLTDQKLLEDIAAIRERADKVFAVRATPTFFINGRRLTDRSDSIESFDKAIEPLLTKS